MDYLSQSGDMLWWRLRDDSMAQVENEWPMTEGIKDGGRRSFHRFAARDDQNWV